MKKVYVGIDVGKSGAIVKLDENLAIVSMDVIPMLGKEYDIQGIIDIMSNPEEEVMHVAIENVHAIQGGAGGSSNFSFGLGKGILMGITSGLKYPLTLVNPKAWQKIAWEGVTKQTDNKKTSLVAAKRLYPNESFLASSRSRVPHDGIVDAVLIAYYIAIKLK